MPQPQSTAKLSSQLSEGGEDSLYKKLNFSHSGFKAALDLMDIPYASSSTADTIPPPIQPTPTLKIRKAAAKPKKKMYASGSLSSSIESFEADPELPITLPISAMSSIALSERGMAVIDPEDETEPEPTEGAPPPEPDPPAPKAKQPKKSKFYFPPREQSVRIPIVPGATLGASTAVSSRLSKLPARGLSRGLPEALVNQIGQRHGHFVTQYSNYSPPKKGNDESQTLRERFEEDVTETIENDQWGEVDFRSRSRQLLDVSRRVVSQYREQKIDSLVPTASMIVSMDLSMLENTENAEASQHLLDVHERLKMRKKMPWKPAERKFSLDSPRSKPVLKKINTSFPPLQQKPASGKFNMPIMSPEPSVPKLSTSPEGFSIQAKPPRPLPQIPIKPRISPVRPLPQVPTLGKIPEGLEPPAMSERSPIPTTAPLKLKAPKTPQHHRVTRSHHRIQHIVTPTKLRTLTGHQKLTSPSRLVAFPSSPSREARELWRIGNNIQKLLPTLSIEKQQLELRALRQAAGKAPKKLSHLCDWQIENEYRHIMKALEIKFLGRRNSIRRSIANWIDNTRRESMLEDSDGTVTQDNVEDGELKDDKRNSVLSEKTDDGFVTEDSTELDPEGSSTPKRTAIEKPMSRKKLTMTRTSDGRVRLPIIAAFDAPESPSSKAHEYTNLRRYLRRNANPYLTDNNSPIPEAEDQTTIGRRSISSPDNKPPPHVVTGFLTPRPNLSQAYEAREIWTEARKRLRILPSLPYTQQREELGVMRKAAGFGDVEVKFVGDEQLMEAYKVELKILEGKWFGKIVGDEKEGEGSLLAKRMKEVVMKEVVEREEIEGGDADDSDFETMDEISIFSSPSPAPRAEAFRDVRAPSRMGYRRM